eukprot:9382440-Alexandrium_andersonii.AAC.1
MARAPPCRAAPRPRAAQLSAHPCLRAGSALAPRCAPPRFASCAYAKHLAVANSDQHLRRNIAPLSQASEPRARL